MFVDGTPNSKAADRSYFKDRTRLRVTSASEVQSNDYSDAYGIDFAGASFDRDTSDTSTAHDGVRCLVDSVGTRFKLRAGDSYSIPFSTTGLLGDGEALPAFVLDTITTFPAELAGSKIEIIDTPPTSNATFTYKYSTDKGVTWTTAFTGTVLAAARTGTFTLAADLTLQPGTVLRPYGPNPHDPTLSGFTSTISALR